jgi:hypothetical protein
MSRKMKQVKFTIEGDIISSFKAKCRNSGESMTSAIRQFMSNQQALVKSERDQTKTRPKRRIVVTRMISLLSEILEKEEEYRDSIPEAFTRRYEISEHACEYLSEAINCLEEAFNP